MARCMILYFLVALMLLICLGAKAEEAVNCQGGEEGCPVRYVDINLQDWEDEFNKVKGKAAAQEE